MRLTLTPAILLRGMGCWMLIAALAAVIGCSAEPAPTLPVVIVPPAYGHARASGNNYPADGCGSAAIR